MEPIFAAVLAGDLSQITAAAAGQRMEADLLVPEVRHVQPLLLNKQKAFLLARNSDCLKVLKFDSTYSKRK